MAQEYVYQVFTSSTEALTYAGRLRNQGYDVNFQERNEGGKVSYLVTGRREKAEPSPPDSGGYTPSPSYPSYPPTPTPPSNRPPSVNVYRTDYGTRKENFDVTYSVSDDNDWEVQVQIEVDNRVKQSYRSITTGQNQRFPINIKDYSDGSHTVLIRAKDSSGLISTKTIRFSRDRAVPVVSSYDTQLGSKYKNFDINYIVTDEDSSSVNVTIKVDNEIVQRPTSTSLGIRRTFNVDISKLSLGSHTITVIAEDDEGLRGSLDFYFSKVNSAPTVSGHDENLGAKNTPFTYKYSVDDREGDNLTVTERVNGQVVQTISNARKNYDYTINVTKEQIQDLELYEIGSIEIEVRDDKGSTTYRRITFSRDNSTPIISGSDQNLGDLDKQFSHTYQVSDPEGDDVKVTVYLDNKILQAKTTKTQNQNHKIEIKGFEFLKIPYGTHRVRIVAEDDLGNSSERVITFERTAKRLIMQLAKNGIKTDELASKILVATSGIYLAKLATLKVEVCNNAFDAKPTWEDATTMATAGRAFNFQNVTKTSSQAGINIRLTIDKGEAKAFSYITAIGGSYE